ncbi:MAG: immunoglobulin domain-containing protein, partial [Planctomycetota bacterium]
GNGTDPGDIGADLAVTLLVSNPAPRPNEPVTLTCSLVDGGSANVIFDFQPDDGRLSVDHDAGTASFIVQESDVGAALTYTCTASDENGVGNRSNSQTIIASL